MSWLEFQLQKFCWKVYRSTTILITLNICLLTKPKPWRGWTSQVFTIHKWNPKIPLKKACFAFKTLEKNLNLFDPPWIFLFTTHPWRVAMGLLRKSNGPNWLPLSRALWELELWNCRSSRAGSSLKFCRDVSWENPYFHWFFANGNNAKVGVAFFVGKREGKFGVFAACKYYLWVVSTWNRRNIMIALIWPRPCNSDHQDYYMFRRRFLLTFIFHYYWEGATPKW